MYPDAFARTSAGVAETHLIDLDFGAAAPDNRSVLILNGWVDWADGSTFRGVAQERPGGLTLPYIQVKDAQGRWTTVVDDMGLPAGKTKTIAVDLSGKFLSKSREVRIVTNLCVYWDQIYLSEQMDTPRATLTLVIHRRNGDTVDVPVICRLDTAEEVSIYEAGGVLQRFAQDFLATTKVAA